jgi:hypothetical protein
LYNECRGWEAGEKRKSKDKEGVEEEKGKEKVNRDNDD